MRLDLASLFFSASSRAMQNLIYKRFKKDGRSVELRHEGSAESRAAACLTTSIEEDRKAYSITKQDSPSCATLLGPPTASARRVRAFDLYIVTIRHPGFHGTNETAMAAVRGMPRRNESIRGDRGHIRGPKVRNVSSDTYSAFAVHARSTRFWVRSII